MGLCQSYPNALFLGLRDAIFDNYDGKVIFLFQEPFTFDPHLEKKISLILKPFTPYFEPSTTIPLALNCSSPPPFYLNLTRPTFTSKPFTTTTLSIKVKLSPLISVFLQTMGRRKQS